MIDTRNKLLSAWTPEEYNGVFLEYVNVMQYGESVKLSIRGPAKDDGSPGDFFTMNTNVWTLRKIGEVLIDASRNYKT